jgi:hypothetical protein
LALTGLRFRISKHTALLKLSLMLLLGGLSMAQQPPINPLQRAAASALSSDPSAIRELTDTVISQLPLTFHPSLNIKDKLFTAELQYHEKRHPAISTGQLASALNRLAADLKLPDYVKTNSNQIRTYRMLGSRIYPALFGSSYGVNEASELSLSPAAATFLTLHLLQLKLIAPEYQTDPDTWVRDTEARRKQAVKSTPSHSLVLTTNPSPYIPSPQYRAIANAVATNSGPALGPMLSLLSTLGI